MNIVIEKNELLASIDCIKLFRKICGKDGRDGGKPFVVRNCGKLSY